MTSTTSIWASHGHNRIHHPGYETEQRTSPSTGAAALKRFLTSTGAEDFLAFRRAGENTGDVQTITLVLENRLFSPRTIRN